jgi:hypothetical protein
MSLIEIARKYHVISTTEPKTIFIASFFNNDDALDFVEEVEKNGYQALNVRDGMFGSEPVIVVEVGR